MLRVGLTNTAHSGGIELKVGRAVAQVAPRSVHTQPVDAVHRVGTLVDICGPQWQTRAQQHRQYTENKHLCNVYELVI